MSKNRFQKNEPITVGEHEIIISTVIKSHEDLKNKIWILCGQKPWKGVSLSDDQVCSAVIDAIKLGMHASELDSIEIDIDLD